MVSKRQINSSIAMRLYGWTIQVRIQRDGSFLNVLLPSEEPETTIYRSVPNYCSNMQEAWKIVKTLRSKKVVMMTHEQGKNWFCSFIHKDKISSSLSSSIELAICSAALGIIGEL